MPGRQTCRVASLRNRLDSQLVLHTTEMAEGELDVDSLISRLLEGEFLSRAVARFEQKTKQNPSYVVFFCGTHFNDNCKLAMLVQYRRVIKGEPAYCFHIGPSLILQTGTPFWLQCRSVV